MLLKNILWDYAGRFSLLFVNLAITGVLSRILTPADYGAVGIVLAVGGLASIFLEFGFSAAIIQQSGVRAVQLSTVFYVALAGSAAAYGLSFLLAPVLARFYALPELTPLLRVSALGFIVNAWNLVPGALITKNMMFREQTIRNVGLSALIGAVAIVLALRGWGMWALVLQGLMSAVLMVLVNHWLTRWRPRRLFRLASIAEMFHFGKYLFLAGVLDAVFTRLDALLIGKAAGIQSVGFYTRAKGMENMVQGVTTSSLNAVMFPYFSKIKDDAEQVAALYHRFFGIIAALIFGFTGLAYINAPWAFDLLFGNQWATSAGYYRILALSAFAYPLSALILNVVSARGNSKDFLKAELWKKLIILPAFAFVFWSLEAFLYAWVTALVLAFGVNLHFLKRSVSIRARPYWRLAGQYSALLVCFLFALRMVVSGFSVDGHAFLPAAFFSVLFSLYFSIGVRFFDPESFRLIQNKFTAWKNRLNRPDFR